MNGNKKGLFSTFKQDFSSSIVVFFVALPLCLGIALASGAPLLSGLIAGIVGGIIAGALSSSALGVSGPAAGLAVIVFNGIQSLGAFEIFLVAVVIGGVLQLAFGALKGGVIAYYFPSSVIKGMLAGIGVIILLKQIPHLFGYDADVEGDWSFQQVDGENTFSELIKMLDFISPGAIIVSVISLGILLAWDLYLSKRWKVFKLIPGPLVAVLVGIGYNLITKEFFPGIAIGPKHLVSVPMPASFEEAASFFAFPDFTHILNTEVWVVGITIAVVASLETLLSVEATDKLDPRKRVTNPNRELLAQGAANIVSGLIGGLPITQVIVRSSANIQSGAQSKISAIVHGILLLICVATIPFILNMIPLAVLACVLVVIGFKLAKPKLFIDMFKAGWSQFLPFMITILGIVFMDLLKGICLGLVVAIFVVLRNSFKNSHAIHKEEGFGPDSKPKVIMTLAEEVTFLNRGPIRKELDNIPQGTQLTIDLDKSVKIDRDVLEIIKDFKDTSALKGIEVEVVDKDQKLAPVL